MTTASSSRSEVVESLTDKAYRDAFVQAEITTTIPLQIKAMRKARNLNQKQLAVAAGMTQARISVLENPDHEGAVNVRTLEKLASALDVGLIVRFAPFSQIVDWTGGLSEQSHNVSDFATDAGLRKPVVVTAQTYDVVISTTSGPAVDVMTALRQTVMTSADGYFVVKPVTSMQTIDERAA